MVTPFTILGLCVLAALAAVILALSLPLRKRRQNEPMTDYDHKTERVERASFRDGGIIAPRTVTQREIAKSPALFAPDWKQDQAETSRTFGKRKPSLFLTPRQLERVNIQRKLRSTTPLTRGGFGNAVAHAWSLRVKPTSVSDWLTYLILYESFSTDHWANRVYVDTGLTITPEAPYYGHADECPGAGAASHWSFADQTPARAAAEAIAG